MDTNFQKIVEFISNWVKLSENEIESISSNLTVETYNKGNIILNQGQTSTTLKFVISGIYRVYQIKNGKEIICISVNTNNQ